MIRTTLTTASLLLAGTAFAQDPRDADFGYHHALDALDADNTSFRVSVNHCRALEGALNLMAAKHGWLINWETPWVQYGPDVVSLHDGVEEHASCPRPVLLELTYDVSDPHGAVAALVDANNLADPPFQASATMCGTAICVAPSQVRDDQGTWTGATGALDLPVTLSAGDRTANELAEEIRVQVAAASSERFSLNLDQPDDARWDAVITSDAFVAVPVRELLNLITAAATESDAQSAWQFQHDHAQTGAMRERLRVASRVHRRKGVEQGLTAAEIQDAWAAEQAAIEAAFVPEPLPARPAVDPGVGPGWFWQASVVHGPVHPGWTTVQVRAGIDPHLARPAERLPHTVPVPGDDEDGDGVADMADQCPQTPSGALVLVSGCSLEQACPCQGDWKNRGEFMGCVNDGLAEMVNSGTITSSQKSDQKGWIDNTCGH